MNYTDALIIKELAAGIGLAAGVAGPEPAPALTGRLRRRLAEGRVTPFEEKDPARRVDPSRLLPGCRSIIVVGLPYQSPETCGPAESGGPRGEVARCARGVDYHLLLEHKTELLVNLLKRELAGPVSYRILADRSPLVERELARQAGLGWIGANCTLVTPGYGSYVALGTILLDREIGANVPLPEGCRGCGRCREACPTGALVEPHILDPRRCLSYLTQASGVVPAEMRPLFGGRLYGCDRCQEACPHNREVERSGCPGAVFAFFPARPLLTPLLQLTRHEFESTIGRSAAGWRGRTTLQRNAVIALGNSGDDTSIRALARVLQNDPRPLLRLHAAWSLGRIGGLSARRHLEACLHREQDPAVRTEARQVLECFPLK